MYKDDKKLKHIIIIKNSSLKTVNSKTLKFKTLVSPCSFSISIKLTFDNLQLSTLSLFPQEIEKVFESFKFIGNRI